MTVMSVVNIFEKNQENEKTEKICIDNIIFIKTETSYRNTLNSSKYQRGKVTVFFLSV